MKTRVTFTVITAMLSVAPTWAQAPGFTISTIAGNGQTGYSGDGGPATAARLNDPRGVVTDPNGVVYFCDRLNHAVRKIDTNGIISTVAGTGVPGYNQDNIPGTQAMLNQPWRVTLDPAGNLYIADSGNNRIRKLSTSGIITTIAGTGKLGYAGDGGPATSAQLDFPEQAELDPFGNLFIADTYNNVVRKVDPSGKITTVAGNGFGAGTNTALTGGYTGDGGPATKAELNFPVSIAVDTTGVLWISDQGNYVIRKVDSSGTISTAAGIFNVSNYSGDGGPANKATLCDPAGIALDTAGNLYITDYCNDVLRMISAAGMMYTVAGNGKAGYSGDGGPAINAELDSLRQVAVGTNGELYIADTYNDAIRKLTPTGTTVGHVTNAFGNTAIIAPNTWIALKGSNLSNTTRIWQASDFTGGQMPTVIDGVTVTVTAPNGFQSNAYIYYVSKTQLNILSPPGLPAGVVQFQVSNNGNKSAPSSVAAQPISPAFFVFDGAHVVAQHLDYTDVGPSTLYPGLTTPAKPGEEVVLYANGFGETTVPVTGGSATQSGTLPATPVVTIGGLRAQVIYAGLAGPGEYQFNVYVPNNAPNGDLPLVATYNGQSTQPGVVITVHQ
jgi:uncharacterized protein (TIGR03437 family)